MTAAPKLSEPMLRALRLAYSGRVEMRWARIRLHTALALARLGLGITWVHNGGAGTGEAVNDVRYFVTTDAGKPFAEASRAARAAAKAAKAAKA